MKQRVIGPVSAVPCPHCGKHNDMRGLLETQLLDTGTKVDCDHCKRISTIVAVDSRPRILVEKA
jgi:hypothetical protein